MPALLARALARLSLCGPACASLAPAVTRAPFRPSLAIQATGYGGTVNKHDEDRLKVCMLSRRETTAPCCPRPMPVSCCASDAVLLFQVENMRPVEDRKITVK